MRNEGREGKKISMRRRVWQNEVSKIVRQGVWGSNQRGRSYRCTKYFVWVVWGQKEEFPSFKAVATPICWGCLGPERGISKFQSCRYIHSRDKAYTVGLIIASEFVRQGIWGSNQRGRNYRCK